jgi:hypothetical protein
MRKSLTAFTTAHDRGRGNFYAHHWECPKKSCLIFLPPAPELDICFGCFKRLFEFLNLIQIPFLRGSRLTSSAQYLLDHIFVYRRDQNLPYKFSDV